MFSVFNSVQKKKQESGFTPKFTSLRNERREMSELNAPAEIQGYFGELNAKGYFGVAGIKDLERLRRS